MAVIQTLVNVAGRADEEVRAMILAANLPCMVDLRDVARGYRCETRRTYAPRRKWWERFWAWLLGRPAPADTVLYEHHLEETLVETHPQDHAIVVNNSDNPEVEVGWTIRLVGESGRTVVAQARVSHRAEYGWTTISPSVLTRRIGRLSEALVSTDQLLPKRWFPEPVDQSSGMYSAPDVFVSEAQEVLRAKLAELEAASAPTGRKFHCPTCANSLGEHCTEGDGPCGNGYHCPTCANSLAEQCGGIHI